MSETTDAPQTRRLFCLQCGGWRVFELFIGVLQYADGTRKMIYAYVCSQCGTVAGA
jgi:hypothetical protein